MNTSQQQLSVPLRFALLIRVSTEKQAKKGESLRTQETQLIEAVSRLSGIISVKYAGQEHATPGWERAQLEALLADAGGKSRLFDAVMVADPSRWSRDNVVSEKGLAHLRDNRIRFFVLTQEHDLYSDDARLFLALQSTINSYQARVQTRKSLDNRIHRARSGVPTGGSMPFGRTFHKASGKWQIDLGAKTQMENIARRYLEGESLPRLAIEFGINESTLYDRMRKSGRELVTEFHSENLNIHEKIFIEIPELLDAKVIEAIRAKAEANTTYKHGHIKHQYLLSRMVFCGYCQNSMSGQYNNGTRYYRHLPANQSTCPFRGHVKADDLETAVMGHLFDCFGNPIAVQRAIEAATPDMEKVDEYRESWNRLSNELVQIQKARERILCFVVKGTITEDQAEKQLNELKEKERLLTASLDAIHTGLEFIPSAESIRSVADRVANQFQARQPLSARLRAQTDRANGDISNMTWDEKRELVEMVFCGKTPEGKRMGVSIKLGAHVKRTWCYTINGHLIHDEGITSIDQSEQLDRFTFGSAWLQNDLLKTTSLVRTPGRLAPIPPRRCCRLCRSTRRADE
jgi:site-specific DNA recombinase